MLRISTREYHGFHYNFPENFEFLDLINVYQRHYIYKYNLNHILNKMIQENLIIPEQYIKSIERRYYLSKSLHSRLAMFTFAK